jgi:shikimate kinase
VTAVRPLLLIGFMGAGKTTVGRILADTLARPLTDLDALIERRSGRSVEQLFDDVGEEGFRDAELDALREAMSDQDAVIACGGGIVTHDESRSVLREAHGVVYLQVDGDEAFARVCEQLAGRPLLQGADPARARAMLEVRDRLYAEVADFTVDTVGRSPEQVADTIARWAVREA